MSRRLAAAAGAAVVMLTSTSCQQLLFRDDHRVTITAPANFATVSVPVTITWTARDFTPPKDGRYAIFVDRDPMPPGDTIDYFKPDNRINVYVQAASTLRLDTLLPAPGGGSAEQHHHDVTVVLLDASGARIGETSAFTEFTVR